MILAYERHLFREITLINSVMMHDSINLVVINNLSGSSASSSSVLDANHLVTMFTFTGKWFSLSWVICQVQCAPLCFSPSDVMSSIILSIHTPQYPVAIFFWFCFIFLRILHEVNFVGLWLGMLIPVLQTGFWLLNFIWHLVIFM